MTIVAAEHGQVLVMVETCIVAEQNLFDRMAFAAVVQPEGGLGVMAGATGFTLAHLSHRISLCSSAGSEYCVMAIGTGKVRAMPLMIEFDRPGIFNDKRDILIERRVTLVTGTGHIEGGFTVMAGSARGAFLHLLHGVANAVCPSHEQVAMAIGAFE